MTGPLDIGGAEVSRASLDIKADDYRFLERLAAYRNAMATAQGKKLKPQWTKKSLAESFVSAQCDGSRQQLMEMFAAVGELPDASDAKAMAAYAARVLAWDKKTNK